MRLFWGSIVAAVLTEVAAYLAPVVGFIILRLISWGAVTYTAWTALQEADIRQKQEEQG